MNIEITRMNSTHVTCARSTIVAAFDARIGDFKIHNAQVRLNHDSGALFVTLPGRQKGGISLRYGELRSAIGSAALAAYGELANV